MPHSTVSKANLPLPQAVELHGATAPPRGPNAVENNRASLCCFRAAPREPSCTQGFDKYLLTVFKNIFEKPTAASQDVWFSIVLRNRGFYDVHEQ